MSINNQLNQNNHLIPNFSNTGSKNSTQDLSNTISNSKSKSLKSKYQNKKYKNHKKNKRLLQIQINEDLGYYNEIKSNLQSESQDINIESIFSPNEIDELEKTFMIKRSTSLQSPNGPDHNDLGSPIKLIRVNSKKEDMIKEYKDNIRKTSSLNFIEGLINGLNGSNDLNGLNGLNGLNELNAYKSNFYQVLSKDIDDQEDNNIIINKLIPSTISKNKITNEFESEEVDIEGSKNIPNILSIETIEPIENKKNLEIIEHIVSIEPTELIVPKDNSNNLPKFEKNNNKKKNKKNDFSNTLNSEHNIKNIDEIKDLEKRLNDVSDYNLIHTPFKMIGEELLDDEISVKYKHKHKFTNESQVIVKKLKENFRKLVVTDIKDKPNLSKILLDGTLSEDVKLKILRKYIRYSTEDEVFSESADRIRMEINNLLKIKKVRSSNDYDEIWDQIENKIMPENLKTKLEDMYYRIITGDESKLTNYVHSILKLPYHRVPNILDDISKPDTSRDLQIQFIKSIYLKLDENLFGLAQVKDSIISYICQRINNPETGTSKYLCLCGPAGVGKTSIVHAISEALQIPYSYLSLANVDVPSTLIGHDYTYEGSTHGCIADAVIKNGCSNGIILFDELDKCKEKIHNTLLGIFDPLQNSKFRDSYFGNFHLDLSENMMIICLNDLEKINPILRDRLHIIHIPGYNADEKCTIVNKYIIPKLHTQYKIDICIEKDVIDYIISNTSQHKGIRQLIMYLTKIYELAVLDKFTYKFNFDGKFKLKDLTHIKLSELSDKPIMSMYV
jgi:ATP-dependent Lon protease